MIANDLIPADDPRLSQPCEPWAPADGDPLPLINRMAEIAMAHRGIGLAAPQIGVMRRLFIMRVQSGWAAIINPEIAETAPEHAIEREGCLTWPGMFLRIERPRGVRARWHGPDGNTYAGTFLGIEARCFLHEFDHLEGRTLRDVAPGSFAVAQRAAEKRKAMT